MCGRRWGEPANLAVRCATSVCRRRGPVGLLPAAGDAIVLECELDQLSHVCACSLPSVALARILSPCSSDRKGGGSRGLG